MCELIFSTPTPNILVSMISQPLYYTKYHLSECLQYTTEESLGYVVSGSDALSVANFTLCMPMAITSVSSPTLFNS